MKTGSITVTPSKSLEGIEKNKRKKFKKLNQQ